MSKPLRKPQLSPNPFLRSPTARLHSRSSPSPTFDENEFTDFFPSSPLACRDKSNNSPRPFQSSPPRGSVLRGSIAGGDSLSRFASTLPALSNAPIAPYHHARQSSLPSISGELGRVGTPQVRDLGPGLNFSPLLRHRRYLASGLRRKGPFLPGDLFRDETPVSNEPIRAAIPFPSQQQQRNTAFSVSLVFFCLSCLDCDLLFSLSVAICRIRCVQPPTLYPRFKITHVFQPCRYWSSYPCFLFFFISSGAAPGRLVGPLCWTRRHPSRGANI